MEKAMKVPMTLTAAKNQGHLDPIFEYLEQKIGAAGDPEAPKGPEWALKRAFDDGRQRALIDLMVWIEGRTHYSPDEAENTEE